MPNQDRTGPEGKGPKTGYQMGKCEGAEPLKRNCGRRLRQERRCFRGRN